MRLLPLLYRALGALACGALWLAPAVAQDPGEFPGLLVVTGPPEEAGEFAAAVCASGTCEVVSSEGVGPARLVPGRDPGDANANPPIDPDEGCTPFTNGDELAGNFALVRSGGCTNLTKFYNAAQVGVLGVVLYHDETVGPKDDSTLVTIDWPQAVIAPIPGLFISRYRGERLLAAHEAGAEVIAEMRLDPTVANEPATPQPLLRLTVAPNPFSEGAEVRYALPEPGSVRLSVYDALGREVARLAEGERSAGGHTARLDGSGLPAGVYLVRVEAGASRAVQRVTLLR